VGRHQRRRQQEGETAKWHWKEGILTKHSNRELISSDYILSGYSRFFEREGEREREREGGREKYHMLF
jgi:hypothetical protein